MSTWMGLAFKRSEREKGREGVEKKGGKVNTATCSQSLRRDAGQRGIHCTILGMFCVCLKFFLMKN